MNTKLLGSWGEEQAAKYLKDHGYEIIGLNFRNKFGEIDVIAENKHVVAFVEVKTRKDSNFAEAKEFVDNGKKSRLIHMAGMWICENETEKQPRFDVIEVYAPEGIKTKEPKINHIVNAFDARGN